MKEINSFEQLRHVYIKLMNAQLENKHSLVVYFNKYIGDDFDVTLGVNYRNSTYYMQTGKDIDTKYFSAVEGKTIKYFASEKEKYSISWPEHCLVEHMIEDVVRALQVLSGIKIKDVYNTPTLIEKIKKDIVCVYEAFTFSEDREGKTITYFDNEYDAKEFCYENGWSYRDKHGYVWALNYRDVIVEKENVSLDSKSFLSDLEHAKECKFNKLFPGEVGEKLDKHFTEKNWKLLEVYENEFQVFFGEGVQVDNNFEYGFPHLFDLGVLEKWAQDYHDEFLIEKKSSLSDKVKNASSCLSFSEEKDVDEKKKSVSKER